MLVLIQFSSSAALQRNYGSELPEGGSSQKFDSQCNSYIGRLHVQTSTHKFLLYTQYWNLSYILLSCQVSYWHFLTILIEFTNTLRSIMFHKI